MGIKKTLFEFFWKVLGRDNGKFSFLSSGVLCVSMTKIVLSQYTRVNQQVKTILAVKTAKSADGREQK